MNNNIEGIKDDSIGTDPTIVQTIDSLDVEPTQVVTKKRKNKRNKSVTPNPDKESHSVLKKIIFTIVVLALMGGVAFGVYYYLSLGTGKTTSSKANFTLDDKIIYVGEELSNNVIDYGNFSTIDISTCTLDNKSVDISTAGSYKYSVKCGNASQTANVTVIARTVFNVETLLIYRELNSDIAIEDFIKSDEEYLYSYANESKLNEYKQKVGGPYSIDINVTDSNGEKTLVYAALYVLPSKPLMYLTCNSPKKEDSNYNMTDKIAFDSTKKDMNISIRTYNYEFNSENEYFNYLLDINDGQISIDNHEGIVIMDNSNHILKIVTVLDSQTLNKEYGKSFPTTYNEINSYYRNTKKYSCSI